MWPPLVVPHGIVGHVPLPHTPAGSAQGRGQGVPHPSVLHTSSTERGTVPVPSSPPPATEMVSSSGQPAYGAPDRSTPLKAGSETLTLMVPLSPPIIPHMVRSTQWKRGGLGRSILGRGGRFLRAPPTHPTHLAPVNPRRKRGGASTLHPLPPSVGSSTAL